MREMWRTWTSTSPPSAMSLVTARYMIVCVVCVYIHTDLLFSVSYAHVFPCTHFLQVVELKPGGGDIRVTRENCVQYIHLLAHWRLNVSIERQFRAFREGLAGVVPLQWLRLFNQGELQVWPWHLFTCTYTIMYMYMYVCTCI